VTASSPAEQAVAGTDGGAGPDGTVALAIVTAAAQAAASVLPASESLTPGPVSDQPLTLDLVGKAVLASFTGAAQGEALVIVGPDLVEALAASALGELDLAEAVRPALNAAVGCWGPVVLEQPVVAESETVLMEWAARGGAVVVPLLAGEVIRAALAVTITEGAAPSSEFPTAAGVLAAIGTDGMHDAGQAPAGTAGTAGNPGGLHLLYDVEMEVTAELGRTRMAVRDLLSLAPGAIIELDRAAGAPTDLLVNGRLIARGEVVVIDENFGLRITEIVTTAERE
jgi:flagellar motor switch protein FliN/FliY